jgi:diguanylate cyclase (GGDEF)-like protein
VTASCIYLVSSVVIGLSNLTVSGPGDVRAQTVIWVVLAFLFSCGVLLLLPGFPSKNPLLLISPVLGAAAVLFIDLGTNDSSAGAQVVFCLPVLYAASQLRLVGALLAAGSAIACDAVLVWKIGPDTALLDLVDLSLVVILMTVLLAVAGRRQDRLVAMLERQASIDPLTGLVTRRVLNEALSQALTSSYDDTGTALLLVDVDHFKAINDTYGHPVGDDALVHVATLLSRQARPDAVISRLGGDELAMLLPGCSDEVARERAEDFLETVRTTPLTLENGALLPISISVGIAHAPAGNAREGDLYAQADASLYQAKRSGRGRVGASR